LGWKISFVIIGIVMILICTAVFFKVVRNRPGKPKGEWLRENVPDKGKAIPIFLSLRMIFGSLTFWQISMAALFRYGMFTAI